MQSVPKVLQFSVIVEWRRMPSVEAQPLEKLDFLFGDIAAERGIFQKLLKPGFCGKRRPWFLFDKLEPPQAAGRQPAVQKHLHAESLQIDVPGLDDRVQERDTIVH